MANVGKDDVVYDLGSGDGRIVICGSPRFRRLVVAVGIEIDPKLVRQSREKSAQKAGVTDRVEFIPGDFVRTNDFRQAQRRRSVLWPRARNIKLRPKMLGMLKPGTQHRFTTNSAGRMATG